MENIINFITNESVLMGIVSMILFFYGLAKAKWFAFDKPKQGKQKKAIEKLEVIIRNLYHAEIRQLKAAKEDGKLTKEEIKEANDKAIASWKTDAAKDGLDVAKLFGEAYLPVIADKVVKKLKGHD